MASIKNKFAILDSSDSEDDEVEEEEPEEEEDEVQAAPIEPPAPPVVPETAKSKGKDKKKGAPPAQEPSQWRARMSLLEVCLHPC